MCVAREFGMLQSCVDADADRVCRYRRSDIAFDTRLVGTRFAIQDTCGLYVHL